MTKEQMQAQVETVRSKMQKALQTAGRKQSEVLLCAASKTQTAQTVALAAELDIDLFGENRVQELTEKCSQNAYAPKPVHLIGQLQTNKVKYAVRSASMIESVDCEKLLFAIQKEAFKQQKTMPVLVQVNLANEPTKGGILPENLFSLLQATEQCPNVQVKGLMCIPPKEENEIRQRRWFEKMRRLFESAAEQGFSNSKMEILSMGMSHDFVSAILEGSTMIRVGTALFGSRSSLKF